MYTSRYDLDILNINNNNATNELYEWFCANKLALNANKTKILPYIQKQRDVLAFPN